MASSGRFIGGISVGVSMDTKRLRRDAQTSQGIITKFVGVAQNALAGVGSAAIGVGVSLAAAAKQSMASIDQLAKTADKVGVTTEAMAGLQHAAELSGISATVLDKAMVNLTKNTSDAAEGVGEAVSAFAKMGLNAKTLNRLSPDKQFLAIADALKGVSNEQDQLNIATKLFGTRGAALINLLRVGSDEISNLSGEAKALGIAISRVDAAKVEEANDAVTRMHQAFKGLADTIAVEISPAITKMADGLRSFITEMRTFYRMAKVMTSKDPGMELANFALNNLRDGDGERKINDMMGVPTKDREPFINRLTGILDSVQSRAMQYAQTPAQIVKGFNNPLMRALLAGISLNITRMQGPWTTKEEKAKESGRAHAEPPSLFESGSRAAYEQRVRIQNQDRNNVENKQLDELKKIAANTAANAGGVKLSPANLTG